MSVRVVDEHGRTCAPDEGGLVVIDRAGPGMARTVWGNPERYGQPYFAKFREQGWYLAGDGARIDADGYVWLQGRVDDVMNVSGHRLNSIELESALVSHPRVAEAGAGRELGAVARLLDVTAGREPGDTTSLVDPDAFTALANDFRQRAPRMG